MKMELRWTEEAATDLEHITDYLFQKTPERAAELVRGIYRAPVALLKFPYRGRAGRKRERANSYLRRFRTSWSTKSPARSFTLSRILHGAQKWP